MNKEDCLREGQPAPDLATIKDFICFYIQYGPFLD